MNRSTRSLGAALSFLIVPLALANATSVYTGSAANLAQVSLVTDLVFSDGAILETPAVSGSV
ncbi:MAG TPA: hypothetical protein VFD38_01630, partial [Myxococcaceae bacterium]|nr:hypothetical protein [Myxococcaceae bacterium]